MLQQRTEINVMQKPGAAIKPERVAKTYDGVTGTAELYVVLVVPCYLRHLQPAYLGNNTTEDNV